MKRVYKKPTVHMELFSLTQVIASGCTADDDSTLGQPNQHDKFSCGWDVSGFIAFTDESVCFDYVGDEVGGVCYNNPGGGATIFGS